MSKKDFKIPVIFNDIPVETALEIDEAVKEQVSYTKLREQKIAKHWVKIGSPWRKIGDYIYNHFQEEISYKDLAEEGDVTEDTARLIVTDLNFYRLYPLRLVPISKRKGFIQSCLKDPNTTDRILRRRKRTIASMEQVIENIEAAVMVKATKREKVKIKARQK